MIAKIAPAHKSKILFFLVCFYLGMGQINSQTSFFEPADTLHSGRFWTCAIGGTIIYSGFSIGLYNTWYKGYDRVGLHSFDDWGEWEQMDKAGHLFTAYIESNLAYGGARWTGMDRRSAMWTAAGVGLLLQTTVEVMDGFSSRWGWSWSDAGFNTLGVGLFVGQELLWEEQRILFKVSNRFPRYSTAPIQADNREVTTSERAWAEHLYGSGIAERFLKDYNGQTIWASFNVAAFAGEKQRFWPAWLNVAVGYGVDNVFGAYGNGWEREDGANFSLSEVEYPRHRQFYLSLDIDMSRIPVKNRFLKTVLRSINWIKIPAPALEFNSLGQTKFHAIYW